MNDGEEEPETGVENIKFYVRILPLVEICDSCVKIGADDKTIYVRCLQDLQPDRVVKSKEPLYWRFATDGIFYNASQEDVSDGVLKDLLSNVLDGANSVIVSYGQTGTGKSFTVGGLRNNWEHRGLIARLLSNMFEERGKRRHISKIQYRLSYVEFYGKQIRDLLVPEDKQFAGNLRDPFKNITSVAVNDEQDTLRKIFEGEARRLIDNGKTYKASHQGTGIVTLHVKNISLVTSWAVIATSKIHIVDMAGIDTVGKPSCLKTATNVGNANLAKTQLEQFFIYLGSIDNKQSNPVARNSSLLKYLGNALSDTSILRFIAHVRVTREDLEFTLSTMRFGNKVKRLKPTKIAYLIEPQCSLIIQNLSEEAIALKRELDINEMFFHQEALMNISNLRAKQIKQDAVAFMNGALCDLTLLSVAQAQVLLQTFKELYSKLDSEKEQAIKDAVTEAYTNVINDLKSASSLSATRLSKVPNVPSVASGNRKWKKGIDRTSTRTSIRSQGEDKVKEKVGDLEKSGITIGPGRAITVDSSVVKAIKVSKAGLAGSKSSLVPSREGSLTLSSQPVAAPKREEAFERFLVEIEEASQLKKDREEKDESVNEARKALTSTTVKDLQLKTQLETMRVELLKQQNIRHIHGGEVYDAEGRILIPNSEKSLVDVVNNLETELNGLQAEMVNAREMLRTLVDNQLVASSKLESAFQAFCEKTYRHAFPKVEEEAPVRADVEFDDPIEKLREKFASMQNMMEDMIKNKPEIKKRFNNYPMLSSRQ